MESKDKLQKDIEELMIDYVSTYSKQRPREMNVDKVLELIDNAAIISANNLKKQSKSFWNRFSMSNDEIDNLVAAASANVTFTLIQDLLDI